MRVQLTESYLAWINALKQRGEELIILLAGGDKSSQPNDIKTAIAVARNLQEQPT